MNQTRFARVSSRLALLTAFAVGACNRPEAVETRQGAVTSRTLTLVVPSTTLPSEVALGASNGVKIEDRVVLAAGTGSPGLATQAGSPAASPAMAIGSNARTGSIIAGGNATLAAGAIVSGSLTISGTLTRDPSASITGQTRTGVPITPAPRVWTVTFPDGGTDVTVTSGTRSLTPGNYATVKANGGTTLALRAGTYFIRTLQLESTSRLTADTRSGPVFVYILNTFMPKADMSVTGPRGNLLFGYFGTATVFLEGQAAGTFVAPNATVRAGATTRPLIGAVFAKNIEVGAGTTVTHVPFAGIDAVGGAPRITIVKPQLDPDRTITREARSTSSLVVAGRVDSFFGVASVVVKVNGTSFPATVSGSAFTATVPMTTTGAGQFINNAITVTATDRAGQTASASFVAKLAVSVVAGRLIVRFNPLAGDAAIQQALASVSATVKYAYRPLKQYYVSIPTSTNPVTAAASLAANGSVVAYAIPETVPIHDAGLCGGTADPLFASPSQWYLSNNANYVLVDGPATVCRPGLTTDCLNTQDDCLTGFCFDSTNTNGNAALTCSTDVDCAGALGASGRCGSGRFCQDSGGALTSIACTVNADCAAVSGTCVSTGVCSHRGGTNFDIGWQRAQAGICAVAGGTDEIIVADAEGGVGVADLNHPDMVDRIWVNPLECCGLAGCPVTPGSLPACTQGDVNGDGCPGVCGVDDDGDSLADAADPDVAALINRLCSNGVDEDGDGTADDCNLTPGSPGFPGEEVLAAGDDDEDGYIDDIHGFDFAATEFGGGELAGSTHSSKITALNANAHGTEVSSTFGATIDNGVAIAGIHPKVRILVTNISATNFAQVMRYLSSKGVEVVNMSWGDYTYCNNSPCTGADLTDYLSTISGRNKAYADGADPSMLVVMSAGNDRRNVTVEPVPDGSGNCTTTDGSFCRWRFPLNVGTYPDPAGQGPIQGLVIAATNIRDQFVDFWLGCNDALCRPGSNYGTTLATGSVAVDFAAPGDELTLLQPGGGAGKTGGTSFSAPAVAGVAALVASRFPTLRHHPELIAARLRATLSPCQAPSGGARGCTGSMQSPGRVNLAAALDSVANPVPAEQLWRNESYRLQDRLGYETNTHDVKFIDKDGNGSVDLFFEGSGGGTPTQYTQRMFAYSAATGKFAEVTGSALAGITPDNIQEAAVADFNGDGCADMAWAGFVQSDPAPIDPSLPIQGQPDRLLYQVKTAGTCTGTFTDATAGRFPVQNDVTRDIDVLDANGDGHPDLFVTNARFEPGNVRVHGADLNDRLLINTECAPSGSGVFGCFVDETSTRLPPIPASDPHNSSAACDVDHDGDLDIVSANIIGPNRLLINDGSGVFADDSTARGVADPAFFDAHDVTCADWTRPGGGAPDGFPELIFARRDGNKEAFLINGGAGNPGVFVDGSAALPNVSDSSSAIDACDLDDDGVKEVIVGNGDVNSMIAASNRVLRWNGTSFVEADSTLGFNFTGPSGPGAVTPEGGVTEELACADLDGDGKLDVVAIGNAGSQKTWLYLHRPR